MVTTAETEWVIFGAGNQGRVVFELLRAAGQSVRAFADDSLSQLLATQLHGLPVWSRDSFLQQAPRSRTTLFVAVGNNETRRKVSERLRQQGFSLGNVIHPSAVVLSSVSLGTGILICPRAVVGVATVVANDVVINTSCSVDHDCVIGCGAYLSPGVVTAGGVRIGERVFVGLGARLGPNVCVGDDAVVAAGAVVLKSVPARTFVAGMPARVVRRLEPPLDYRRLLAGTADVLEVPHGS